MNNIISSIKLIYKINEQAMNDLTSQLQRTEIPKKTYLVTPEKKNNNIYFIEKGIARSYNLIYGKEVSNHSIFRHDDFIGCFSADKIKMSARKYFCFNIPVYKNMAEGPSCRSPYHEEYIQTSASGNPEDIYRSTYSFLSGRR